MKNISRLRWLFLIFAIPVFIFFLGACNDSQSKNIDNGEKTDPGIALDAKPEYVIGVGRVEPEGKTIDLRAQSEGIINKVNIKLGDKVTKDQILFMIDSKGANEQVAVVESQIDEQKAAINSVKINIEKTKINKEIFQKNYNRLKSVYDKGAETVSNLENAESALKSAIEDEKQMRSNLNLEEARLKEFEAVLRSARSNTERYMVQAPTNGQILGIEVALGSTVSIGSNLGQFAPDGPMAVVTEIDELYATLIKMNQIAYIHFQGSRDTVAIGRIVELSPALRQKSLFGDEVGALEDRRVREVKIRIHTGTENLIFGARVEALINLASHLDTIK